MAAGFYPDRRIVRSYGGRLTGETIYVDDSGQRWTTELSDCGTGVSRATLRGNSIVDERPCDCAAPKAKPTPPPEPPRNRHERRAAAAKRRAG